MDIIDGLFKKYSGNAVSIICSGKLITFIELEPLTRSCINTDVVMCYYYLITLIVIAFIAIVMFICKI